MSRASHVGKNKFEKQYYNRVIHEQDYDPTIDDSLEFSDSDKGDDEVKITRNQELQRVSGWVKAGEFIKENWMKFVVSAIACLLLFFVFNFNRDIGKLEGRFDSIEKNSTDMKSSINAIYEGISSVLQRTGIIETKIQYIEKDIDGVRDDVDEIKK